MVAGDSSLIPPRRGGSLTVELHPHLMQQLLATREEMSQRGELHSVEKLTGYYATFRGRFGPEVLKGLDGEALLQLMHGRSNRDSLVYWLEFKGDAEFPEIFGSIAGGSALKFGLYFRNETTAPARSRPCRRPRVVHPCLQNEVSPFDLAQPALDALVNVRPAQQVEVVHPARCPLVRLWEGQSKSRILVDAECAPDRHQSIAQESAADAVRRFTDARPDRVALHAFGLAPRRTVAWSTIGMLAAKRNVPRLAVACLLAGYRFSNARGTTLGVYMGLAEKDEDPRVREVMEEAVKQIGAAQ
jgi:hypothetical protein